MKINKTKGFTLVELLVVIAIIGILSSVVIVSMNSSRAKARDAKRVSDIKQFQLALAVYQDANGGYPTDIYGSALTSYMPTLPKDPSNSANYRYAYYPTSGTPTTYHLGTSLELSNTVLNDDKDCNSSSTSCPGGAAYTGGFNGADSAKCNSGDYGASCFDVTP
jgi:type II secretion system protein G